MSAIILTRIVRKEEVLTIFFVKFFNHLRVLEYSVNVIDKCSGSIIIVVASTGTAPMTVALKRSHPLAAHILVVCYCIPPKFGPVFGFWGYAIAIFFKNASTSRVL